MADPVSIGLIAASTAFSAVSQVAGAQAQSKMAQSAANSQIAQFEDDRALSNIQAIDDEQNRRRKFEASASSQMAMAAGMGYDPTTSGSFAAIQADEEGQKNRDILNIRLMGAARSNRFDRQISDKQDEIGFYKGAASRSWLSAGATLMGGAYKAYGVGWGGGTATKAPSVGSYNFYD